MVLNSSGCKHKGTCKRDCTSLWKSLQEAVLTLAWSQRKENRKRTNKPFFHPQKTPTNQPKQKKNKTKKHSPKKTLQLQRNKQNQNKTPKTTKEKNQTPKQNPTFASAEDVLSAYFSAFRTSVCLLPTSNHTLLSCYSYLAITVVSLDTEAQSTQGSCRASEPGSESRYAKVQCLLRWILLRQRTGVSPGQV